MIVNLFRLNIVMLFMLSGFITSCSDVKDTVPTKTVTDTTDDLDMDDLFKQGQFSSLNGYTVRGNVELFHNTVTNTYSLILSNFLSSNGPDLKVYLSEGAAPSNFYNLGALKSTNGVLRYNFSGDDFDPSFSYILIWCDDFSVSFGRARLSDPI